MKILSFLAALRVLPGIVGILIGFSATGAETIDAARIREIAAWLPAHAVDVGQPITNRAAWEAVAARHPELGKIISLAGKTAAKPLPAQPDSLFLECSKNGNRDHWQKVASARRERIGLFTLAECLENQGRFLAPLEQTIAALCAIAEAVEGPVTAMNPASALQLHPQVTVFLDEAAAAALKLKDYYRWVYDHKPAWQKF